MWRMAGVSDVQVQGLCRFSFPCTGGFKKYHQDLNERRGALYDPARLDMRVMWFERVFLPSIAAQTDPDFTIHVLMGEDFPEPWRSRMETHFAAIPQLEPHWRAPGDHRAICRDVLWAGRDMSRASLAEFRLDDDDAVAINYVQQLKLMHRKVARLAGANGRVALDHGKGMVIQAHADGRVDLHVLITHCWSAALAIYLRPGDEATVMDFPHHKIWQRVPFVNLSDTVMFIRGDHATNDAKTPFAAAVSLPIAEQEQVAILARRFHVDFQAFLHDWETLSKEA